MAIAVMRCDVDVLCDGNKGNARRIMKDRLFTIVEIAVPLHNPKRIM